MTRGRRKDLTIPPSRALLQQRDYRARKAQYVSDLEERCRKAEVENAELRKEVDDLKRRLVQAPLGPSGVNAEVVSVHPCFNPRKRSPRVMSGDQHPIPLSEAYSSMYGLVLPKFR